MTRRQNEDFLFGMARRKGKANNLIEWESNVLLDKMLGYEV